MAAVRGGLLLPRLQRAYELIEFWTALAAGRAAEAFLGTQGDVWDTQWDMQMALIGAVTALATLTGLHDRQLRAAGER